MAKSGRRTSPGAARQRPAPPERVETLVERLRLLNESATADDVRRAIGDDGDAVRSAAAALARAGDPSARRALEILVGASEFLQGVVEALGTARTTVAAETLERIAGAPPDKEVGKAARRALRALESAGLRVAMPQASNGGPVFRPPPPPGVAWIAAMAGPYGAEGVRPVLLAQARHPTGGAIAVFMLSDVSGIVYADLVDHTHRQLEKEWRLFLDERAETLAVEVSFAYAQWLVTEAAEQNTALGVDLPEDYLAWIEFTGGRAPAASPRLIYDEAGVDPTAPPGGALERSADLIEQPECETWAVSFDAMASYGAELLSARHSPLVLSEAAAQDRERQIVARATDAYFTRDARTPFKRRLEETALLFLRSGRMAEAQAALAAAIALGDETWRPSEIPFASVLIARSISGAAEVEAPTTSEGQLARSELFTGR